LYLLRIFHVHSAHRQLGFTTTRGVKARTTPSPQVDAAAVVMAVAAVAVEMDLSVGTIRSSQYRTNPLLSHPSLRDGVPHLQVSGCQACLHSGRVVLVVPISRAVAVVSRTMGIKDNPTVSVDRIEMCVRPVLVHPSMHRRRNHHHQCHHRSVLLVKIGQEGFSSGLVEGTRDHILNPNPNHDHAFSPFSVYPLM